MNETPSNSCLFSVNAKSTGRGLFQTIRNVFNGDSHASEAEEADDARSFGLESDYYGDATIASTPGRMLPPPVPSLRLSPAASVASPSPHHHTSRRQKPAQESLQVPGFGLRAPGSSALFTAQCFYYQEVTRSCVAVVFGPECWEY